MRHAFVSRPGVTRMGPAAIALPLYRANEALDDLRAGRFEGAAVLVAQPP